MKVLYVRSSSLDQKTDRQRVNQDDYDIVIEDKCSGAIGFFDRPGGKEVIKLIEKNIKISLYVLTIDRLGRDLRDILNTIYWFNEKAVTIYFVSQGLRTLDDNGKENPIAKLMISVLGTVAEMERNQIRERQLEGIRLAKLQGKYQGRKPNSKEDVLKFLNKEKNRKALNYLKAGHLTCKEVSKLTSLNINTITKIKKLGLSSTTP